VFRHPFVLFLALLLAGAGAAAQPLRTTHYLGREVRTDLAGRLPYGEDACVLMREERDGGDRIVETVTQAGRSPSSPALVRVLTLTRRGRSLVFDAVEGDGDGRGTRTYTDAGMGTWRSAMERRGGGREEGGGEPAGAGFRTRCAVSGSAFGMLLTTTFTPVGPDEYARRAARMRPPPGAE